LNAFKEAKNYINEESYRESPTNIVDLPLSYLERIEDLLSNLSDRQRQIITLRFGLDGNPTKTLEESSKNYGVTRERIRQIETKAKIKIKRSIQQPPCIALVEVIDRILIQLGGIGTEEKISLEANKYIKENAFSPALVNLVLDSCKEFFRIKSINNWCLSKDLADLYYIVTQTGIEFLNLEFVPISQENFIKKIKSSIKSLDHLNQGDDSFILACLKSDDRFTLDECGSIGLKKWDRTFVDEIIVALRKLGKPSHYSEIAKKINEDLHSGKPVSAHSMHNDLMRYPDIFIWIGRKGTYGLKEWGLEKAISYANALEIILRRNGHPMTFEEVLAKLPEIRPYYDESSVLITLGTIEKFKGFSNNTYGLAIWKEDNFLTDDYRIKRILNNGINPVGKKPKKDVIKELLSVDDFISTLRENKE
jgi:hypothetical protein